MTRAEKLLFHQIHPIKLLTDFGTSFASCSLMWQAQWGWALGVAFAPSIIVTALLVWRADLEPLKQSTLGEYIAQYMTRRVVALRSAGQLLMWIGAAAHVVWLLPLGFVVIVFAWLQGMWS